MTVETVSEPAAINITVKPPHESRGRILELDVLLAIGMGIFMGRMIEFPALRLRDRLFPSLTRR